MNKIFGTNTSLKYILFLGFICFISVSLSGASSAATANNSTIYVSIHGNDNWNGLSATHNTTTGNGPKATIMNATSTVENNGTIYIANGFYNESFMTINSNMTLIGQGQTNTIISAKYTNLFEIPAGITLTLENLTITSGSITNFGTLMINNCTITDSTAPFGAVNNFGNLTIKNSKFTDNTALDGGAIDNSLGTVFEFNTLFINNSASGMGGAIANRNGNLTETNCTFINNTAYQGAAIWNTCNLSDTKSTFIDNNATYTGGAIYNIYGNLTVTSSTFYGNNATIGGVLYNAGNATLNYNRILNNTATTGNDIYNDNGTINATLNWWGTNTPNADGNDIVNNREWTLIDDPWIILTISSTPLTNGSSTIYASLLTDNEGQSVAPLLPEDILVSFSTANNNNLNPINTIVIDGIANSTYTSNNLDIIGATIDNQTVYTNITSNSNLTVNKSKYSNGTTPLTAFSINHVKTVPMQNTGAPIIPLVTGALSLAAGLISTRKYK